ncbi:MAG: homoserine kinase, partial [Gemmatimonadetes bacterium]|nr:homoserine kinase [Gemmatimonadota bacterium]
DSVRDVVAEPRRSAAVPGFGAVVAAAKEAGALACGLSGSGPSIFALARGRDAAKGIAAAMKTTFDTQGVADSAAWISAVGAPGARVVDG